MAGVPFGSLIPQRSRVLPQGGAVLGQLTGRLQQGLEEGRLRAAEDDAPNVIFNYLDTIGAGYGQQPTLGNLTGGMAPQPAAAPAFNGMPTQENADLQTRLTPGSETFDGRFALRRENAEQQNPPPVAPYAASIASYGSGLNTTGLDAQFGTGLDSAIQAYIAAGGDPSTVQINSLVRSTEEQQRLYDAYQRGEIGLAAPPGRSRHEYGAAADIQSGPFLDWLHQNAGQYGLSFLQGDAFTNDPGHVQLAGPSPAGTRAPAMPAGTPSVGGGGYAPQQPAWSPPTGAERQALRAMIMNPFTREQGMQLAMQRMTPPEPAQPNWTTQEFNGTLYRVDVNSGRVEPLIQGQPSAADRPTAEDQNGILRYRDTGEPVFPNVQTAPEPPDFGFVNVPGVGLMRTNDVAGTAETIMPAPPAGPNFENEESLRDNFRTETSDYRLVQGHFERLQAAAANPSAAGDIAMVYGFMKMLDPSSVVRETEYATAQNAAGVDEQVRNVWNRVLTGERLSPEQRADFLAQAGAVFGATQQQFNATQQRFISIAQQYGIDPARIFGEAAATAAAPTPPPTPPPSIPPGAPAAVDAQGNWVYFNGTAWVAAP